MYKNRPPKTKYPRLDRALHRNIKLSLEDQIEVAWLFAWGVPRGIIAEGYLVSYHSIYLLTCNAKTREAYERRKKEASRKANERRKATPEARAKFQAMQKRSREHLRKVNAKYREFQRLEWLRKNPPKVYKYNQPKNLPV